MEDGWIKLHRKMREWQHYSEPSVLLVFIDLLLSTNSKDGTYQGMEIKRGQTSITIDSVMEHTRLARNTVRLALRKLEESGEIRREKSGKGTITTVLNFEQYQGVKKKGSKIDPKNDEIGSKIDPKHEIGSKIDPKNDGIGSKIDPKQEYINIYNTWGGGGERARVREEAMLEMKVENACRAFSISRQEYVDLVEQVLCDWAACDEPDWSYRHLYNTLRIKASERRKNNGTAKIVNGTTGTSAEGREQRAAAVAATIARLAAEDDARASKIS